MADYDFYIGQGSDVNIVIRADNGDVASPAIRYTSATNIWEISNDGTTFAEIGSTASTTSASYTSPSRIGGWRLWPDTSVSPEVIRCKYGSNPSSITDGKVFLLDTGAAFSSSGP